MGLQAVSEDPANVRNLGRFKPLLCPHFLLLLAHFFFLFFSFSLCVYVMLSLLARNQYFYFIFCTVRCVVRLRATVRRGRYAVFLEHVCNDANAAEEYYKLTTDVDPTNALVLANYAAFVASSRNDIATAKDLLRRCACEIKGSAVQSVGRL